MSSNAEVKRTLILPRNDVERFKELHPGHGDMTWFFREVLKRYVELHDSKPLETIDSVLADVEVPK